MDQTVPLSRTERTPLSLVALMARHRAALLLGLFVVVALASRLWDLGARALHHDESLHALYSFYLYDEGRYQHDPLMHGPVLFHLTALGYWLFGATDFTSRLVPALLGVLLVWSPWKFRGWLGTRGALVASALLLISPTMLYYSRFIRHDIFLAMWTVVIVYGSWKYLEAAQPFHLYLAMAGWALAFSQKEVSFLLAAVFWAFFLAVALVEGWRGGWAALRESRAWHLLVTLGGILLPLATALLLHLVGRDPAGGYNATTYQSLRFLQEAGALALGLLALGLAVAALLWDRRRVLWSALIFYTLFVLFHTTLLTWPWGIGSGVVGALGYWIEQHGVERGGQPWFYYALLVPLYEFLPLMLGVGGGLWLLLRDGRRWRAARRVAAPEPSSVRGRRRPVGDNDDEAPRAFEARALWPWFNLWWLGGVFFALSYAGEKMPWLLVHIALPLCFLAGWAMGRLLDAARWERLRSAHGLLAGLLGALATLAALALLWMGVAGQWPLGSNDLEGIARTGRWLAAIVALGAAGWGLSRLRATLGGRASRDAIVLVLALLMALATVRFAVIAAFRNGDTPNEPLIYTQSSPQVPMVMREIETISRVMTGGKGLKIAYDNETLWPFAWYLRDYPEKFYYAASPDSYADQVREAAIVLVGLNQEATVKALLPDYIRHHYSMRPNFPEDYKDIIPLVEQTDPATGAVTYEKQVHDLPALLANTLQAAAPVQARRDFLDFLWNRRVETLGRFDFVVYVRPDIASEVWQYGLTVATMDPELTRDPYADQRIEQAAALTVGLGQLTDPKALAVLPDGTLALADSGNHRIVLLSPQGEVQATFGSFGEAPGQFNEPWGIAAAPDGTIYVADTWNHRVQHLDAEGTVLHVWGSYAETGGDLTQPGTFWGPRGIAVDGTGNVWVTDTGNKRVEQFDAEGTFLGQFGGPGVGPGQFAEPVGIAVAPDGTIWVADTWNRRVQGFSADFTPLLQFPVRAWEGQSIINKPAIAASQDRIWISDPEQHRLLEFNREGELLRLWGAFGSDERGLNLPLGLAWDGDTLWVADSQNNRVLGFR